MRKGKLMFMLMVVLVVLAINGGAVAAVKTGDSCGIVFFDHPVCGESNNLCKCQPASKIPIYNYFFKTQWKCEPCGEGKKCEKSGSRATCVDLPKPGGSCTVIGALACVGDNQECVCKSTTYDLAPKPNLVVWGWQCTPCITGNSCNANTGRCEPKTPAASGAQGAASLPKIKYGDTCSTKGQKQCSADKTQCICDMHYPISSDHLTWACSACTNNLECNNAQGDCKPATASGGAAAGTAAAAAEKKKQEEDRNKQCKAEVGTDYSCTDITQIKKEDYDCRTGKCKYGTDAQNVNIQCCKSNKAVESSQLPADEQVAYNDKVKEIAASIAEQTCKPALEKSKSEWEDEITKAKSQCDSTKMLLPQEFLPLASQIAEDCKKEIDKICSNVKVSDKKTTQLNDCSEFCKDPDGCTCYMNGTYQCAVGEGGNKSAIRYEPGTNKAHVQQGSNCLGASGGICSGSIRDGICPRQCFFFNDVDCMSQKTAGFLIGDIAMRFMNKQKWYTDFMEWIAGWSSWIDPQHWVKSWCNPANRKQGIMDSVAVYSEDGELFAWYGGEMAVYNYTSTGALSRYLYTITWGIGNLQQNASYRISLMKDWGGPTVRAFPANAEWYDIKAGESHQGKETAKAFFLKTVYNYVCMEFKDDFQGSKQYCREISPEGEYRATGDPAVVTTEGYTTATGSSTAPSSDSGVNCQLEGTC